MPRPSRILLLTALVLIALTPSVALAQGKTKTVHFCFWNVENLFDDKENKLLEGVDREFDRFFAGNPKMLEAKLDRIAEVLLAKEINGGKGPDVLCLAEVESKRAVELVQQALQRRLRDKALHYPHLVFLDPGGGRGIATAVLSRVPVVGKPVLLSSQRRILKVTLEANKKPLTVIASHWTSRVSDKIGRGRAAYAEAIHKDFAAMYAKDARVAYLVCGDFNDGPDDPSVTKGLQATGELGKVLGLAKGSKPILYNPFVDLAKKGKGTHYFGTTAHVFDQVCVSPGMLDGDGWQYRNRSAAIVEKLSFHHRATNTHRPDRFGGPDDRRPLNRRGASDHYPVTVELKVGP